MIAALGSECPIWYEKWIIRYECTNSIAKPVVVCYNIDKWLQHMEYALPFV